MQEQENTKERDLKPNSVKGGWKRILNYQSIVKQIPFFLFLALLAVIYIYNGWMKTPSQGRMALEIKENPAGGAPTVMMHMQVNPFNMADEWSLLSDGTVAIVRVHDYHIDWIDPDNRWPRSELQVRLCPAWASSQLQGPNKLLLQRRTVAIRASLLFHPINPTALQHSHPVLHVRWGPTEIPHPTYGGVYRPIAALDMSPASTAAVRIRMPLMKTGSRAAG